MLMGESVRGQVGRWSRINLWFIKGLGKALAFPLAYDLVCADGSHNLIEYTTIQPGFAI